MSTGGISLLLAVTPHRFNGLDTIGIIIFIFDILLFIIISAGMTSRFLLFPGSLKASLMHPTESLFFPTLWLSCATIISNISQYGVPHTGPWLLTTLRIIFWIYCTITFISAVAQYNFLFTAVPYTLQSMTPGWILPIFPIMLSGTLAAILCITQPVKFILPILVGGLTFQGLGFMVSLFMYGNYIGRLMTAGLPSPSLRPGMFITVGPPSFTALALLGMAKAAQRVFPAYNQIASIDNPGIIGDVLLITALLVAILLWTLGFWFFSLSLVSTIAGILDDWANFHLSWWSFVFPNVGFTIALISIGHALESQPILWIGSVMTVILVMTWLFVLVAHARAVATKAILWPGKD
jgi:C4-dicarboxylate transporter/malic acid transport protein